MLEISRVERLYRDYPVTATTKTGVPVTLTGVDIAILPPRTAPDATTIWTATTYINGVATVLLAGPDAAQSGAITIPAVGAAVWLRVVDNPEVDVTFAERISVI